MLGSPIVVRAFSNKYFYLKEKTVRAQYVTSYNILTILLLFQKVARFFFSRCPYQRNINLCGGDLIDRKDSLLKTLQGTKQGLSNV